MFARKKEKVMSNLKWIVGGFLAVVVVWGFVRMEIVEKEDGESSVAALAKYNNAIYPEVAEKIEIEQREIHSVKDIEPITGKKVKPIDYLNAISLDTLPVKEKKQYFIDLILPAILIAKEEYKEMLDWVNEVSVKKDSLTGLEKERLAGMMEKFRAKNVKDLKVRLVTHPTSIVLAQASIESGWGTSRFFVKANNIFGVWSFNPNDPRIPTLSHRNGKKMYLYKYKTLSASVNDYFKLLATRQPFAKFREERVKTKDPYKLVEYLTAYSERGEAYVNDLKTQIRHNNFTKYDTYTLDKEAD